jgi:hypothetical protein
VRARWWLAILGALLLVAALGLVGVRWWHTHHRTDLETAVSLAPADAARLSWTDWASVRRLLHAQVDADSTEGQLSSFLNKAYGRDLASTSAMIESEPALQREFGFSPATLDWELFSQSSQGAVVIMKLPDSTDMGALGDTFSRLGYERPDDQTGVWRGGVDLLPALGTDLTPELQFFAMSADDHLLLSSDRAEYLGKAMDVVSGDADHLTSLDDVVHASGDAVAAAVYTGDYTCSALAMSQADAGDQSTADDLLAQAGEVNPMTGMSMAIEPGGGVRVEMSFESNDQARTNADTRATLASGPAPGQGGSFTDRFTLGDVSADGTVVSMTLKPQEGQYVLSDLSTGPVLFLTC